MFVLTAVVSACASPEAARSAVAGPATIGNHAPGVTDSCGAKIYHKTPCRTVKVQCSGPLPSGTLTNPQLAERIDAVHPEPESLSAGWHWFEAAFDVIVAATALG